MYTHITRRDRFSMFVEGLPESSLTEAIAKANGSHTAISCSNDSRSKNPRVKKVEGLPVSGGSSPLEAKIRLRSSPLDFRIPCFVNRENHPKP